jgi:uroporphyrinogen-III synthase
VSTLAGRRIVVTRARDQASTLVTALESRGAEIIELPVIAIVPAHDDGAALRAALARAEAYEWIVVTSTNGVAALLAAADVATLARSRLAAVGPATADALRQAGLDVALMPARFVAEGLVADFPEPSGAATVLVAQADRARPVLVDGLRARGWNVEAIVAYRTVPATIDDAARARVAAADAVTFTSGSTVDNFVAALDEHAVPSVVVSIGPVTTAAARRHGIEVTAEAMPHTIEGLVDALVTLPASAWGDA